MITIPVGFSPCPNDTFLFYGAVHGRVDTEGYRFQPVLEDVETLNRWALNGKLPMTKVSYGVLGELCASYWCLRSGGALGRGCGPLVIARERRSLEELARNPVAVPGLHTTANLLLELRLGHPCERVPLVFHEIMPAVSSGRFGSGVIIHESRFTYAEHGLVAVEDLGRWWEQATGLPIPLGGILLRRDLSEADPVALQRVLRRSVEYALEHPDEPMEYVRRHSQELEDEIVREHIALYVNDYSADIGAEGEQAVRVLLRRAVEVGLCKPCSDELFPPA